MASKDLDRLCSYLASMQADQLYFLEDETSFVVLQIRGMPVHMAVASIRDHIAAIPGLENRLRCICRIYVCLMKNSVIGSWVLYHVSATQAADQANFMISCLEKADFNRGFIHWTSATTECTLMCALVQESDTPNSGFEVYCFCFWPSRPCLAVYRPPEGYSVGQRQVMSQILKDDSLAFKCGVYDELYKAHLDVTSLGEDQDVEDDVASFSRHSQLRH